MSALQHFIGIDPGPVPGIVILDRRGRGFDVDVIQCSTDAAPLMLWALLAWGRRSLGEAPTVVQIERFVSRGRMSKDQQLTADMVAKLQREAADHAGVTVVLRSASNVKPWATDERLEAAGLLEATKGMRHARDAARHALFAACRDGGVPDPLSTRSNR